MRDGRHTELAQAGERAGGGAEHRIVGEPPQKLAVVVVDREREAKRREGRLAVGHQAHRAVRKLPRRGTLDAAGHRQ